LKLQLLLATEGRTEPDARVRSLGGLKDGSLESGAPGFEELLLPLSDILGMILTRKPVNSNVSFILQAFTGQLLFD